MNTIPSPAPMDVQGFRLLGRRISLQQVAQGGMGRVSLGKWPQGQCEMPVGTRPAVASLGFPPLG